MKVDKKKFKNILLVMMLLLPIIGIGMQDQLGKHAVWIVTEENGDTSTDIAVQVLRQEIPKDEFMVSRMAVADLERIPVRLSTIIIVGHGHPEGFETVEGIVPWSDLYDTISSCQPKTAIVLACYAPSNPSLGIFGFDSLVDAEAGGIIVG